jgi:hypothetical protein
VRRTSSIDTTRPDGPGGPMLVDARGRDLRTADGDGTAEGGAPSVVAEVRLRLVVDETTRAVVEVEADPPEPALAALVGRSVGPGFRRAVAEAVPEHRHRRTLLHLLLDDLPGAGLVSGYAVLRDVPIPFTRGADGRGMALDLCAGWAADGSMMRTADATGLVPTPQGPPAPALEPDDDPRAWHAMAPLPVGGMRRRRRLDLRPAAGGHRFEVHFRDSHQGEDAETVLHEYLLASRLRPDAMAVAEVVPEARVLPWAECPGALGSAAAVVGVGLDDLDAVVRRDNVGVSSCTHLNDTLRSLADLGALALT